ncbi:putative glycoside hydrolase [Serpentinicella sp. ANB-PHB4]|uniref:putative glycoside hydrolase n=1 Tax=Serpentinicella sp. ANB-PHB4 TaxID=3074076 RepID=UPI00285C6C15|nr:putative glycoside hydrolase [Serpentinicella sp. ANB-PHB4]MDR5658362.1 putative glycoside hydrolase [Serpentinicella sp. ANB-PHB4]
MRSAKSKKLTLFILISSILILNLVGCNAEVDSINSKATRQSYEKANAFNQDFKQEDISWEPYKITETVKAIFMTGNSLAYNQRFEDYIERTNRSVINSWVVDVKDDDGIMTYKSNVQMAQDAGADARPKVRDFHMKMQRLRENDIYPIARIVTFKDKIVTAHRPDLAIKTNTEEIWRDNKGDSWLNPYNRETWDYVVDIAKEAAQKGFMEIQFDYVRFPTDGNRKIIDYGKAAENESMAEAIANFLDYAREELKPYGVYVSADIFGLVTTVEGDMRLGQQLEKLTTATDILAPMVYPSHYAPGTYGVPIPDQDPYHIVYTSMNTARERVEALETDEPKAILRPWLQDFTASYLGPGNFVRYGPKEVQLQIDATYDAGLEEWILWNARNVYNWDALLTE